MSACVADTHAVIWHLMNDLRLSPAAAQAMQNAAAAGDPVFVSAITLVEIVYLIDKGWFPQSLLTGVVNTLNDPTRELTLAALDDEIAQTMQQIPRATVPDMPDRIIAATALHLNLPLVTADHKIQAANIQTIW
jgi:PIN domain nuclease of toxin-antitoxin system